MKGQFFFLIEVVQRNGGCPSQEIACKYQLGPWVTGQLSKNWILNSRAGIGTLAATCAHGRRAYYAHASKSTCGVKTTWGYSAVTFVWGSPDASWIQKLHFHERFGGYHSLWLSLWPKIFDLEVGNKSELMSLGAHCDNWTRRWNEGPGGKVVDWMADVSESASVSLLLVIF